MVKCEKCGADVQNNTTYCPYCGQERRQDNSGTGYRQPYGDGYNHGFESSDNFDPRDIEDNKVLAVLCYFGPLLLIPLLTRPYSQYVKYHANQGILLLLLYIATGAVGVIPLLGWAVAALGGLFSTVLLILGVIYCLNGQAKPLPIIGKYTILN